MSKALERSIDMVESLGKINRHGLSTVRRTNLIKAPYDLVGKGEEGSGDGPVMKEAMMSGGKWEVAVKFWQQEAFQDFVTGAEEGDGTKCG